MKTWLFLFLLGAAGASHAAATRDEIMREALLRGYNTADAERRYNDYQRNPQAHVDNAGDAMANLVGTMAASAQRRMNADRGQYLSMYDAIAKDLDYPLETRADVDAMRKMLLLNAREDDEGYRYFARKRLIEYALHLRPHASEFFAKPDYVYAATELRKNAYSADDFFPWSALMLGRLYLAGRGVPQDDVEAQRLIQLCLTYSSRKTDYNNAPDQRQCKETMALMVKEGWAQ